MNDNLFSQGLELLVYGMGTVVVFLTLLVFATRLMSAVIQRFLPQALVLAPTPKLKPTGAAAPSAQAPPAPATPSPELLAAIASAVHQHRRRAAVVTPLSDSAQRKAHV